MRKSNGWRIAAASVAGTRHAELGEPCQDRHHVEVTLQGALIAIVSDGAGSASHGGEGAAILCNAVADRIRLYLMHGFYRPCTMKSLTALARSVRDGVRDARALVMESVERRDGASMRDYHATLVGAVTIPGRGGLFFHIGDGAALAMSGDGSRWTLSPPSNGEFADTTYFFTEDRWWTSLRFSKFDADLDTLFVMSDGVTDLGLSQNSAGPSPFMGFFKPIGSFLAEQDRDMGEAALIETLSGESVCARTTDDKTLIWASLAK